MVIADYLHIPGRSPARRFPPNGDPQPAILYDRDLKSNSMTSVVSSGPAANFQSLTASIAEFASTALPPRTLALFTFPSLVTITEIRTLPERLYFLASSGYTASTWLLTLRLASSCARSGAGKTASPARIAANTMPAHLRLPTMSFTASLQGYTGCAATRCTMPAIGNRNFSIVFNPPKSWKSEQLFAQPTMECAL